MRVILAGLTGGIVLASSFGRMSSQNDERVIVAALDTRYQAAVRSHDAATMSAILADDFAVVTALLWEKGTDKGTPFDYRLWFSDTYVRTPGGWRYVFGQASLPLPSDSR